VKEDTNKKRGGSVKTDTTGEGGKRKLKRPSYKTHHH
jgi:hypothetical protein